VAEHLPRHAIALLERSLFQERRPVPKQHFLGFGNLPADLFDQRKETDPRSTMRPTLTPRGHDRQTPWLLLVENGDRLLNLSAKLFELSGDRLADRSRPIFGP
jgi:hypothetical protein